MARRFLLLILIGWLAACAADNQAATLGGPSETQACSQASDARPYAEGLARIGRSFELTGREARAFVVAAGGGEWAALIHGIYGFEVVGGPLDIPSGDYIVFHADSEGCLFGPIVHLPRADYEAAMRSVRGVRI